MVRFIDDHREKFGVEPICAVLPIAPATYYAFKAKQREPETRSSRAKRDEVLRTDIQRVHDENFAVYGAEKVWRQLGRAGVAAAFSGPIDTVANAVGGDETTQILLRVTEVNESPTTDVLNNTDQQAAAVANAAGDDILDQMVSDLQTKYGYTVNRNLAEQAMVR